MQTQHSIMANIGESIVRSHSLKDGGIELTGVQVSKEIIVKANKIFAHENNEVRDISDEITIYLDQLKSGLDKKEKESRIKSRIDFQYADYCDILNGNIKNSEHNFKKQYYVDIDTEYSSSIALLKTYTALVIETDDVLLDKPLILELNDEEKLMDIKENINSADSVLLYSEDGQLRLEIEKYKTYSFKDSFGSIFPLVVFAGFSSLLLTVFSIWAALLFILTAISLYMDDIRKFVQGKIKNNTYFVDYGLDSNSLRFNNIIDAVEDNYIVNISDNDESIIMKADDIDAEWKVENKGVLPDSFVELFKNIGFENIDNNSFELNIKPTYKTSNTENCLVSECGIWYINPEQHIQQKSKKVLQNNYLQQQLQEYS